ncbi:MAG TPA: hypothetical protein VK250_01545 [Nitrososphaeraceae archaeon]|nr:hypothetical protein [Nitrososphaeraceae archaeon]
MTSKKIVLASIAVIVATGLLVLNPLMMIGNAKAEIQKIKCVNSNININGVDITQVPQDNTAAVAAANEEPNTENGNGLADRINFDRNLVNICVNVNDNEQINGPDQLTCEDCLFSVLNRAQIATALEITDFDSIDELCDFFAETPNGSAENLSLGLLLGGIPNITDKQKESIVNCLAELGLIILPPP